MKVEFAFLCQQAKRISPESVDARGVGTRRYVRVPNVPDSPVVLTMDLVVVFRAEQSEAGIHELEVLVRDRKGNRLTEPGAFEVEARKSADKGPSYISVIANLEASIREVGRHHVLILMDRREVHRTHFIVEAEMS